MGGESLYFLARRASTLMLGFSVLLFLVRNTPPSVVRQAIAFSIGVNMTGFALSGSLGLIGGLVNMSIVNAIVIEVLVAAIYFSFGVFDGRHLREN